MKRFERRIEWSKYRELLEYVDTFDSIQSIVGEECEADECCIDVSFRSLRAGWHNEQEGISMRHVGDYMDGCFKYLRFTNKKGEPTRRYDEIEYIQADAVLLRDGKYIKCVPIAFLDRTGLTKHEPHAECITDDSTTEEFGHFLSERELREIIRELES